MGSKRARNKIGVYCRSAPATTIDHVFARTFFPVAQRDRLPSVPSYQECNKEKSVLEHYLAPVLPFGARHSSGQAILTEMVPRHLANNQRVARELAAGYLIQSIRTSQWLLQSAATLPIEGQRLERLIEMVVRGLLWHHCSYLLPEDHEVIAWCPTDVGEAFVSGLLQMQGRRIGRDWGDGAFRYEALLGSDPEPVSAWRFVIFCGLKISETGVPGEANSASIVAISGSQSLLQRCEFRKMLG